MQAELARFQNLLGDATFAEYGDPLEQERGHYLAEAFPTCEQFWRVFVIPLTSRIESYPGPLTRRTAFRRTVDDEVRSLSAAHYSMFSNLTSAHAHLNQRHQCWFEDTYVHLGAACDLAELVVERWYLLRLRCSGEKCRVLESLSRDEFLALAGAWYDERYPSAYAHYLSRGKPPPIKLLSRADIVTEYLGTESAARKAYASESQLIRQYRNVIVHDSKIGRIQDPGGDMLVPKARTILKYRTWREVEFAAQDRARIESDFEEATRHLSQAAHQLETALDSLWQVLVQDFTGRFFTEDRTLLHDLFDLSFRSQGPLVLPADGASGSPPDHESPPSGTVPSASAIFPPTKQRS